MAAEEVVTESEPVDQLCLTLLKPSECRQTGSEAARTRRPDFPHSVEAECMEANRFGHGVDPITLLRLSGLTQMWSRGRTSFQLGVGLLSLLFPRCGKERPQETMFVKRPKAKRCRKHLTHDFGPRQGVPVGGAPWTPSHSRASTMGKVNYPSTKRTDALLPQQAKR